MVRFVQMIRLAAILAVALVTHVAMAQVSIPGDLSVNRSGAAVYSIPIQLPPGIAGIEPKLSLAYSSQSGSGFLGLGWSLNGLSAISRCPRTLAQDGPGYVSGVRFAATDAFCMDGQRLVLVSGSYGVDGSEYSTELDSFSRIVAVGAAAGGGPNSFVVTTKAGLTMEYGNTPDSRILPPGKTVVRVWALNRVSDVRGNYLTATYTTDAGQYYPVQMDYTGNASTNPALTPKYSIVFAYDASRLDLSPTYVSGVKFVTAKRLASITTKAGGSASSVTSLNYASDKLGLYLQSITTCDSSQQTCLVPSTFSRTTPAANFSGATWSGGPNPGKPISNQCLVGDFNGDGRSDEACYTGGSGQWHVSLSTGSGWTSAMWGGGPAPGSPITNQCVAGDFNGDGKTDLLCYTGSNSAWAIALSTGSGWATGTWPNGASVSTPIWNQCLEGDFNGDGKTDVACHGGNGDWHVTISSGAAWVSQRWTGGPNPASPVVSRCMIGDFDGDGRTDIGCFTGSNENWHVVLSKGDGWGSSSMWGNGPTIPTYTDSSVQSYCRVGDFNGDGKADLMCYLSQDGTWRVSLSTGVGWDSQQWTGGPAPGVSMYTPLSYLCLTSDLNGDGKTDIACRVYGNTWNVALSTGTGLTTSVWSGPNISGHVDDSCQTGDFNGDGKSDIACSAGDGNWTIAAANNSYFNRTDTFAAGLAGAALKADYSTPAQLQTTARYTMALASASPRVVFSPTFPVVSRVYSTLGGVSNEAEYAYDSAMTEIGTGRGFLGFNWVQQRNVTTGMLTRTFYRQDFPYTGQIDKIGHGLDSAAWNSLGQLSYSYTCTDFVSSSGCNVAPGNRYFVYPGTIESVGNHDVTSAGAVGSGLPGYRTVQLMDEWGNPTSITIDTLKPDGSPSGFKKVTTNTYTNIHDSTHWFIGRLMKSVVTSSAP